LEGTIMKADGYYRGRVKAWDFNNDNRNKTYQLVLTCQFTDYAPELAEEFKEITNDKGEPKPIRRNISIYFSENRKGMALKELASLGFDKPCKVAYLQPGNEESFDFSRAEVMAEVTHNEKEDAKTGKPREYENWNICTRRKAAPLSLEAASNFDSMYENYDPAEEAAKGPF
jgi:hypothetical protein